MSPKFQCAVLCACVAITAFAFPVAAQPPTADASINKDRALRLVSLRAGKNVATTPKRGFFGTIFNLIVEQINDTKSAYTQISDLVNNQFAENDIVTPTSNATAASNGTTEAPKITRAEFLKILDRNLKGLARLRSLEWREAKKDSWANLDNYKNEIFSQRKARNGR
ncbi:unnamed protein product [Parnassius mnemosyne]|uniref:RxLR effector protein n=1 Tax=Parnassius mnemosyne TaxID=213953 RepID=A0AAV1M6F4_9NEOP